MNRTFTMTISAILLSAAGIEAKVVPISSEDELNQQMNHNKNMVVEYSADWCSVCNGIKEPFEQVSAEPEFQKVAFAQVDVDKLEDVSKKNGVVGVPTFVYLENGAKKVEEIGVQNIPEFKNHLRDTIRQNFYTDQSDDAPDVTPSAQQDGMVDSEPAAPAAPKAEPNFVMKIIETIKNFIIMIAMRIVGFFTMIIDAIKGFFGG